MVIPIVLLVMALQQAGTLGAELRARALTPPPDAMNLEQPITSYAVLDDMHGFVIAYYERAPDNRLGRLHVRSFDRRSRTWHQKTYPEPIGSVLSIRRGGNFLYVGGHSSPSAAPLLVLSPRLERKRTLDGFALLVLPDGRVVFHRSMIHFAPTHASALALYDPISKREFSIYPADAVQNHRGTERAGGLWVDRSIDSVRLAGRNQIQFDMVEQRMRLEPDNLAHAAAPERRLTVSCDVSGIPSCRVR